MIFSFIPASVLALCGILALFRPTRTIAIYLASVTVCSTGLALALGSAGLAGAWWFYPYSGGGGDGQGLAMVLWLLVGGVIGGLTGIVVGVAIAHKLTRGRPLF